MALSDRAEEILAKQLGNGRAAEQRAALDTAYNSGGNDVLNSRGRQLIANLFGLTRGEEFCAISDAAGLPSGSRVEEMLVREFGSGNGLELLALLASAYGAVAADQNEAGFTFDNVGELSGETEDQMFGDDANPENFYFQTVDAAKTAFISSFVGDGAVRTAGDVIVIAGSTAKIRAHVHSRESMLVNTWSYQPKAIVAFANGETVTVSRVAAADAYSPTYDTGSTGSPASGKMTFDGASSLRIHNDVGGSTLAASLSPGDYVAIFKNVENDSSESAIVRVLSATTGASHGTITASTAVDLSDFNNNDVVTLYKMVLA